jgi:hypothetical protein
MYCCRSVSEISSASTSAPVNTESFQRAMELLDEVADLKRKKDK